jgi:DNA-binding CsgD family transcriptional regulator
VKPGPALENLTAAIVEICRSGLAPEVLRERVLPRLRRAVPFDAAFWATVDPATLLFSQPHQQDIPPDTIPYFIQNEFFEDDVNKWTTLARDPVGVRTLVEATAGEVETSARHRDIFDPLGLGDELRAVFRIGGECWGYVCLHRQAGAAFSSEERSYVRRLAPHLAEAIRTGLLVSKVELSHPAESPGLVLASPDGSLISMTATGERWLAELGHPGLEPGGLPAEIRLLVAIVGRSSDTELPRLPVRTPQGRWAVLHASRLPAEGAQAIAVIIEEPSPAEIAPVLMMAYGLTKAEQTVTRLVCRGLSTRELSEALHITQHTVQDHLKSIFDKTGVHSRRELVATILQEQYLPRAMAGQPLGHP